jgi:hypothetical protein
VLYSNNQTSSTRKDLVHDLEYVPVCALRKVPFGLGATRARHDTLSWAVKKASLQETAFSPPVKILNE